jgi:hypothetical protein
LSFVKITRVTYIEWVWKSVSKDGTGYGRRSYSESMVFCRPAPQQDSTSLWSTHAVYLPLSLPVLSLLPLNFQFCSPKSEDEVQEKNSMRNTPTQATPRSHGAFEAITARSSLRDLAPARLIIISAAALVAHYHGSPVLALPL